MGRELFLPHPNPPRKRGGNSIPHDNDSAFTTTCYVTEPLNHAAPNISPVCGGDREGVFPLQFSPFMGRCRASDRGEGRSSHPIKIGRYEKQNPLKGFERVPDAVFQVVGEILHRPHVSGVTDSMHAVPTITHDSRRDAIHGVRQITHLPVLRFLLASHHLPPPTQKDNPCVDC